MNEVPYDFEPIKFRYEDDFLMAEGFSVKVYCLFDGLKVHSFFKEFDLLDNAQLCMDCGVQVSVWVHRITATPFHHSDIYKALLPYVSNSDSD